MSSIRIFLLCLLSTFISACSSVGSYQTICEQKYPRFSEMVKCSKTSVNNDFFLKTTNPDLLKLYFAYADALAVRVEDRTMTETDARLALAAMLTKINAEWTNRAARTSAALNTTLQSMATYQAAIQPVPVQPVYRPITCHQVGIFTNCS